MGTQTQDKPVLSRTDMASVLRFNESLSEDSDFESVRDITWHTAGLDLFKLPYDMDENYDDGLSLFEQSPQLSFYDLETIERLAAGSSDQITFVIGLMRKHMGADS